MPNSRFLTAILLAGLFGGLIGGLTVTLITVAVTNGNEDERGTVVRLSGEPENLFYNELQVRCSDYHRFCIPRFEAPEDARAFYLGETHEHSRQQGCFVEWRPGLDVADYAPTGEPDVGGFRGICSGSLFLRDGTRVFGPAPRDLDQFPVEFTRRTIESPQSGQAGEVTYLEVDTRTLICGEYSAGVTHRGCELAPSFD